MGPDPKHAFNLLRVSSVTKITKKILSQNVSKKSQEKASFVPKITDNRKTTMRDLNFLKLGIGPILGLFSLLNERAALVPLDLISPVNITLPSMSPQCQ